MAAKEPSSADCHDVGDLVVAVQMLATPTVFISLFYLTNSKSVELRKSTWSIIEATASIVAAIMLAETGKDMVYLVWRPEDASGFFACQIFYAILCSVLMQLASFFLANSKGISPTSGLPRRLLRTRAFAGTVARFTGFAWITLWGRLQYHRPIFFGVFPVVLPCALLTWMLLMCLFTALRWCLIHRDGVVSEEEEQWEMLTSQNEIDAAGLTVSFLMSQAARFYIGGTVPNPGGVEHAMGEGPSWNVVHTSAQIFLLGTAAVTSGCLALVVEECTASAAQRPVEASCIAMRWFALRLMSVITNTLHKTTGWLLLIAISWSATFVHVLVDETQKAADESVQVRAITSVLCSYVGFLGIILLKFLPSNAQCVLPGTAYTVGLGRFKRGVLQSLALMVGFSWRRCYGLCIDYVSRGLGRILIVEESSGGPDDGLMIMEVTIGIPVAVVVLPALYWYISPNIVHAEAEEAASAAAAAALEADGRGEVQISVDSTLSSPLNTQRSDISIAQTRSLKSIVSAASAVGDLLNPR